MLTSENNSACSFEIISQISQPASSIFLSQKTSQQYFQPAKSAQANRLSTLSTIGHVHQRKGRDGEVALPSIAQTCRVPLNFIDLT
jgi:hypothetical protein